MVGAFRFTGGRRRRTGGDRTLSVATLLEELRHRDIHVWPEGDQLRCNAPAGVLTPDLRAVLRERKGDIVQFLQSAATLASQQRAIVPLQQRGSRWPVFAVPGHNGDVFSYRALSQHLGADQPFFGLQTPGLDGQEPFRSVVELAAYFAAQIRGFHRGGPCVIAGYCAGGTIAFELARQLMAGGVDVRMLAMFAGAFPTYYHRGPQRRERIGLGLRRVRRHVAVLLTKSPAEVRGYITDRLSRIRENRNAPADPLLQLRHNLKRITADAVSRYEPQRFEGALSLFIPSRNSVVPREAIVRWAPFARESSEVFGPDGCEGDVMLLEPHAPAIARLFETALSQMENVARALGPRV
jgi:thioesterase domain-containing protein